MSRSLIFLAAAIVAVVSGPSFGDDLWQAHAPAASDYPIEMPRSEEMIPIAELPGGHVPAVAPITWQPAEPEVPEPAIPQTADEMLEAPEPEPLDLDLLATLPGEMDGAVLPVPSEPTGQHLATPPSMHELLFSRPLRWSIGSRPPLIQWHSPVSYHWFPPGWRSAWWTDEALIPGYWSPCNGLVNQVVPERRDVAVRFGGWYVDQQDSLTKTGEYQDLKSSPFWDVDWLSSTGGTTLDFVGTGLDNEDTSATARLYHNSIAARVDYTRFPHRLDHDPLENFSDIQSNESFVSEDLNAGEDFAIRVQQLDASFRGKLTHNLKYRFNVSALKKSGERQAIGFSHCFRPTMSSDRLCHSLSRRQTIDWTTVTLEPVIEGQFGRVNVEYSRPIRMFNQADQLVTRSYGSRHGPIIFAEQNYAFVPENVNQSDRLKISVNLTSSTQAYASLRTGDSHNKFRDLHRRFNSYDLRLVNRSWDAVTLTGFVRRSDVNTGAAPFFVALEDDPLQSPGTLPLLIDYSRRSAGVDARWRLFPAWIDIPRTSIRGGWQQESLLRTHAVYSVVDPANPPNTMLIEEEATDSNVFHVSMRTHWLSNFHTRIGYRKRLVNDPLFGVREITGTLNTSLPQSVDTIQFDGTWSPSHWFLVTATAGWEMRRNRSDIAQFDEDNYPVTATVWYAPTDRLAFSGGYGYQSNWIDQTIYLPGDVASVPEDAYLVNYGGHSHVLNLGVTYTLNSCWTLVGGYEYLRSRDAADPFQPWPDVVDLFDVLVERRRITAGADWIVRDGISAYIRYVFLDYEDKTMAWNSGSAHMFLAGATAFF